MLPRFARFFDSHAAILLPGLTFLALVIIMNWRLFVTPMFEWGDVAANELQVHSAKHLHELLGNYSRWHFHHPGPFLFYLFAAGEAILYDWLHLVPAPLNAECLTEIFFSVLCLFLAIYVFYANVKRPLFPAIAILTSILFLYALDTAIPNSALVALWQPYTEGFAFLLLASSAASVGAGELEACPAFGTVRDDNDSRACCAIAVYRCIGGVGLIDCCASRAEKEQPQRNTAIAKDIPTNSSGHYTFIRPADRN